MCMQCHMTSLPSLPTQHGNTLQDDYNKMKAEMPWLQLEDEDLDGVQNVPSTPKKPPQAAELEVGTILVVSAVL